MGESPIVKKPEAEKKDFTFPEILLFVIDGKKVSKREWGDLNEYVCMHDGLLCVHHKNEKPNIFHALLVSDGDILGDDWFVLEEVKVEQ